MSAAIAPPPAKDRRRRVAAGVCAVVALAGAFLVLAQATFAGHLLTGNQTARTLHQVLGTEVLGSLLLVQLLAAVAVRWPGGGPWWPLAVTAAMWPIVGFQIGAGFSGRAAVHVPLGVGLLLVELAIAVGCIRNRRGRPTVSVPRNDR